MSNIYIKNMVCDRCLAAVKDVVEEVGLAADRISLGEVVLRQTPEASQLQQLDEALVKLGFERIDDRRGRLIEAIKNTVIRLIHHSEEVNLRFNWSTILAEALHHDYNHLSSLFSSVEGITLEQYIIRQKIERAKELLFYDELTLSAIADKLGYSSVAHLSTQFKKITGLTPSGLKKMKDKGGVRKPLDQV